MRNMRASFFAFTVLLVVSVGAPGNAVSERPSLEEFNEEVAVCRRVMREACAILQDMVREGVAPEPQAESLALIQEVRRQWAEIREKYSDNPPVEFERNNMLKMRFDDIANAMDDMERALENGEARRSFRACGFGCGLFVALHEGYGLEYALNQLFHLRRDIRRAMALVNTKGIDSVRQVMPDILQKRNVVLLAPAPWPRQDARYGEYWDAVQELSEAIDSLAFAFGQGNNEEAEAIVSTLLAAVNRPYGIAL